MARCRNLGRMGVSPRARRSALVSGERESRAKTPEITAEMVIKSKADFISRKDRHKFLRMTRVDCGPW